MIDEKQFAIQIMVRAHRKCTKNRSQNNNLNLNFADIDSSLKVFLEFLRNLMIHRPSRFYQY